MAEEKGVKVCKLIEVQLLLLPGERLAVSGDYAEMLIIAGAASECSLGVAHPHSESCD